MPHVCGLVDNVWDPRLRETGGMGGRGLAISMADKRCAKGGRNKTGSRGVGEFLLTQFIECLYVCTGAPQLPVSTLK